MIGFLRWAREKLAINLPILLMAMMALGTYWLLRSTPAEESTTPDFPLRKEPDYIMEEFAIKTFDDAGRLKSEVKGRKAKHYPHTDILEIEGVEIRSFNTRGQLTTATAQRALANGDTSEVQLIGQALVVREEMKEPGGKISPRVSYAGEFLHAFLRQEKIKSHKPIVFQRGNDTISADSMELSDLDQNVELRGRVRGVLQ